MDGPLPINSNSFLIECYPGIWIYASSIRRGFEAAFIFTFFWPLVIIENGSKRIHCSSKISKLILNITQVKKRRKNSSLRTTSYTTYATHAAGPSQATNASSGTKGMTINDRGRGNSEKKISEALLEGKKILRGHSPRKKKWRPLFRKKTDSPSLRKKIMDLFAERKKFWPLFK